MLWKVIMHRHSSGKDSHDSAEDLIKKLVSRGLLETETTVEADGTTLITCHPTSEGMAMLDKLMELLDVLILDPAAEGQSP
jgi:DNA-binding PadR family transcriptional regulator